MTEANRPKFPTALPGALATKKLLVSSRHGRSLLLGLLLCAVSVNILQFRSIDRQVGDFHHMAIYRFETSDIAALSLRLSNVRNTMNLYWALGQVAPGITLIVPRNRHFDRAHSIARGMVALGRVKEIKRRSLTLPDPKDFTQFIVAQGEVWTNPKRARLGEPGAKWAIATQRRRAKRMLLLENDEFKYFLLDTSLLKRRPSE